MPNDHVSEGRVPEPLVFRANSLIAALQAQRNAALDQLAEVIAELSMAQRELRQLQEIDAVDG